jgi:predicted dehydrogenase
VSKVRIGFVGVGAMGQCAHLRNYVAIEGCEVVALAEYREDLGKRVAERYGVPRVYANHEELLDNEKLDGLVAVQHYARHGSLLPALFAAGLPVLTEKPLACSVEAGQKILEALSASQARHLVAYHKRSDPATMYARKEIERLKETGELGAMRYVRITMPAGDWVAGGFSHMLASGMPIPPVDADPPPADMDDETRQAYDSFVNYYIHQINLMRHLLGEDYSVSYADPTRVQMTVHSTSGVAGVIEMSPFETTVDWQEEALVAFERGYVKLALPAPLACNRPGNVTLYHDAGSGATPVQSSPQLPWVDAMRQQAVNFVSAIQGEETPLCTAEAALKDLAVARDYIRALEDLPSRTA